MQAVLPRRTVIRLSGADADQLLQGIITQDIGLLTKQPMLFSAMLSAQGKFAHDFFIIADGGDRLIDIDSSHADAFVKKLKMYKLRANVSIEQTDLSVEAAWGEIPEENDGWMPDPRLAALGWRKITSSFPRMRESGEARGDDAYEAHRLALAIPDGALDATDRMFALELGYDQLNGVSFNKGCFVGQEPTARMHYRKVLRKGFFRVQSETGTLPPPETPIMAGESTLGEMRSASAGIGLAFCRMEQVQQAQQSGADITANHQLIQLQTPNYMQSKWEAVLQA